MRLIAIGRQLLIRMDFDLIESMQKKQMIALPPETIEALKGGCQIATVLSVGASAFDDEPPRVQQKSELNPEGMDWIGRTVLTGRYPGHGIDIDPMAKDVVVGSTRLISSDEVHAIVALEDEEGADV